MGNFKFYQLYVNEATNSIKVSPAAKNFQIPTIINKLKICEEKEIIEYNGYYWFSQNRATLVAMGRNIKAEWVSAAERKLEQINSIKI